MSVTAVCHVCSAALSGTGVVCRPCVDLLLDDLRVLVGWRAHDGRLIPGLLDDLTVTASRQDRVPTLGGQPDGRADRTLDARFAVAVAVVTSPGRFDALALRREVLAVVDDVVLAVSQLGAARLHQHPRADEFVRLVSAQGGYRLRVERLVDRPDGGVRVPCPTCGRRVTIDPAVPITRCRCREWGDVAWWTQHVAPAAPTEGTLLTARDVVGWMLVRHGVTVSEQQIRQWATRGKVDRRGKDDKGRTLYDPRQILGCAMPRTSTNAAA